jgi:tetratricopeptide (TPR) repeat protein
VREIRRLVDEGRDHEVVERLKHRPYEELRTSPELAVLFATALVGQGRLYDAHQLSAVALTVSRALGDDRGEALATMLCGDIALARGNLEGASSCFSQARALATKQRNAVLAGECSERVGQLALRRDDPATAAGAFVAAITAYESAGAEKEALECQPELARAYCALAKFDDALGAADRAVDAARDLGDPRLHAEMVAARAEVRLTAGDPAVALSEAVQAAAMYRSLDEFTKEADALRLAKRAQAAMDPPRARARAGDQPVPSAQLTREKQKEAVQMSRPELIGRCHV